MIAIPLNWSTFVDTQQHILHPATMMVFGGFFLRVWTFKKNITDETMERLIVLSVISRAQLTLSLHSYQLGA